MDVIRRRKRTALPSVAPTNLHNHNVSEDAAALVDAPVDTVVERASGRRVYRTVSTLEAPSPLKRARTNQSAGQSRLLDALHLAPVEVDERYELFGDDPLPPVPPKAPRKGRGLTEPSMAEWRTKRPAYLNELLRRDGTAGAEETVCAGHGCDVAHPQYRCQSCHGVQMFCQACCVAKHESNPLHIVEYWDGCCFAKKTLKELGLRIQFGHHRCVRPRSAPTTFVVLHTNGIHEVNVDYCGCESEAANGEYYIQLLRGGWYPATHVAPQTAATFELLDFFHAQMLQAKTTMYDFYIALEKLTNNTGVKPSTRYPEFLRITRQYRHLLLLKRAGRGHDPSGIFGTQPGECAVLCPACPRPGINLPDGWENVSAEQSELRDPGLGTGWAYFTENEPYRQYLLSVTDQKEISTCSGLAALDYANTKFSRGYSSTGVGMGVCARHEFVQPNGVVDLQKGERYANMDYIFASILRHWDHRLKKVISYDIVCQWWKMLKERLLHLPPLLRMKIVMRLTDGEGIERPWANIGGVATSTREQGPGFRRDTLDDHWNYWNWVKLTLLPRLLRRRLDIAKVEAAKQADAFEEFSQQQAERVAIWRKMVEDFEGETEQGPDVKRKCKNPYACVVKGKTEADIRLEFSTQEAEDAKNGVPALHDVSPSGFIYAGLELEEEQRRVRLQAELKTAKTTGQQISMSALRTKLTRGIQRFRKLQALYTPAALQAAARVPADTSQLLEDAPLFLPSALSDQERATGCTAGLVNIETRVRDAQCRSALVRLRNQLHIKSRGGDPAKVGWQKLRKRDIRLLEDPEELSKRQAKHEKQEERRRARERRLMAEGELPLVAGRAEVDDDDSDGEEREARGGESVREVSWIWTVAGMEGTDAELEDVLRIEWAKAYARSRRWKEEVMLLEEEMRRVIVTFEYNTSSWDARSQVIKVGEVDELFAEGAIAYAIKQARMFRQMAEEAKTTFTEERLANGKKRRVRRPAMPDRADSGSEGEGEDKGEDEGEDAWDGLGDAEERGDVHSDEEVFLGARTRRIEGGFPQAEVLLLSRE
ncbi:hypothetical protein C8F04DRAFT_1192393 [Mycena alexandri]|uniref:CxC2-like cysteine cluster KDZ transposase-associated domain-containing protein n=1 Tax=Mycena alexandri TaxID=1745969 RepID=A0AAD6SEB5_9AGAR|nr:hypothetical protein C8F04DRAFT_1192393 [Mycena alexandri]